MDHGKRLDRLFPGLTALQRYRLIRDGLADDSVDSLVTSTIPRGQVEELYDALAMFQAALNEIALPAITLEPELRSLERGVAMLELMEAWAADHELLTALGRHAIAGAPGEERSNTEADSDRRLRQALEVNDRAVPRPLNSARHRFERPPARTSEDAAPDSQALARQLREEARTLWSRLRTFQIVLAEVRGTLQDEELLEELLPLDDHEATLLALRDRLRFEGPFEFDEPHDDELDALRVKVGLGAH